MKSEEKRIAQYGKNIEEVLTYWGFPPNSIERSIKLSEIKAWISNFSLSEIEYAIKIMENIQYYDDNKIRRIIEGLSGKIEAIFEDNIKDVLFFPLGCSSASSGSMYLYEYRKELRLSEKNFKQDSFEKYLNDNVNIVFFDDIIGSGKQAIEFFNKFLKNKLAKCHYFSLLGFQKGISYIKTEANFKTVIAGKILTDENMAFSEESYVFPEKERNIIKSICEKYGSKLFENHPLGYDNTQALIVFAHNTPNNTLPVIWGSNDNEASSSEILWYPLWNRKKVQAKIDNKTKNIYSNSDSLFDTITREYRIIKEKISSYINVKIVEEENSDFISYNIQLNSNNFFLKVARNVFFDTDKSVLIWFYKNKQASEDASFNAIAEQHPEGIKVINLGIFLGKEELEISFLSVETFIKEILNEIDLFSQQNYA